MDLAPILETILFVHAGPMHAKDLAKIAGADVKEVKKALVKLKSSFEGRGVVLLEKDDEYQLGTNPAHASFVEALMKSEFSASLSRASLETAAIVAYKGPITKANIEYLRGVNSAFSLRNLLMRGLVERVENPKDTRSFLYRISFDFLKHLGVTKLEELPEYKEFHSAKIEIPDGQPPEEHGA